jgi:hypothetical protein
METAAAVMMDGVKTQLLSVLLVGPAGLQK